MIKVRKQSIVFENAKLDRPAQQLIARYRGQLSMLLKPKEELKEVLGDFNAAASALDKLADSYRDFHPALMSGTALWRDKSTIFGRHPGNPAAIASTFVQDAQKYRDIAAAIRKATKLDAQRAYKVALPDADLVNATSELMQIYLKVTGKRKFPRPKGVATGANGQPDEPTQPSAFFVYQCLNAISGEITAVRTLSFIQRVGCGEENRTNWSKPKRKKPGEVAQVGLRRKSSD